MEHYVISSGLREIIEGSAIASAFREIYASEFLYDADVPQLPHILLVQPLADGHFPDDLLHGGLQLRTLPVVGGSEFLYDAGGRPLWPKLAVNFTAKTQFVYRINKGVLDVSDDKDLRIMVYI